MRRRPQGGNRSDSVYLDPDEYKMYLDVAKETEERVYYSFRIAGEASPRVGRIVRIKRGDFYIPDDPDVDIIFLQLTGTKDTTGETEDGEARITWVPRSLYEAIEDYCERNGIGPDDYLFDIGPEQLRNLYHEVGRIAADRYGMEGFAHVRPQDGRRYYATTMLRRYGVRLEIVMDLGGWRSRKAMEPYLGVYQPREIQDELARAGILETNVPAPPRETELKRLFDEVRRLRQLFEADCSIKEHDIDAREVAQMEKDEWAEFKRWKSEIRGSKQTRVTDFEDANEKRISVDAFALLLRTRLSYEYDEAKDLPAIDAPLSAKQVPLLSASLLSGSIFIAVVWEYSGIYGGLATGDPTAVAGLILSVVIGLPYIVWNVHESSHADPTSVEPKTELDRLIIRTHAICDPIASRIADRLPSWWTGK